MSEQTFVFNDVEVKKTGRTASKPGIGTKSLVLVEITPVSEYDGDWKKWVPQGQLFNIDT